MKQKQTESCCSRFQLGLSLTNSCRHNYSETATFQTTPFAEGTFRYVSEGIYTSGEREGQKCVVKWFKDAGKAHFLLAAFFFLQSLMFFEEINEEAYLLYDLAIVDQAIRIVNSFNATGRLTRKIRVNCPSIWTITSGDNIQHKG